MDDSFWKIVDYLVLVADLQEDLRKKVSGGQKDFLLKIIYNPKTKKRKIIMHK